MLTGATSGIGEAAARVFAKCGATLVLVARNEDKVKRLMDELQGATGNRSISPVIADLGKQDDVREAARQIHAAHPVVDVLAHNAGALFNERKRAANGTDLSIELMVAAPFLLTGLLLDPLRESRPGRVITMSSGGMYTAPLSVSELAMSDEDYQGAKQYARAKRAQVSLNELWAAKVPATDTVFHSLHPGWVNTPGINDALPGFSKVLGPLGLLRTPLEGADTMVWLAVDPAGQQESGSFWLDRAIRDPHMLRSTRESDTAERRERLWKWCADHTGWNLSGSPAAQ